MRLGKEEGLGPSDIVLDEDPAPHGKGHSSQKKHKMTKFKQTHKKLNLNQRSTLRTVRISLCESEPNLSTRRPVAP